MSARRYAGKLAANKRYSERHPEKYRAYKKRAREWAKARRERSRPKIKEDLDGCFVWMRGVDSHGYGRVRIGGGPQLRAHRVMWERHRGKVRPGMVLHHKCGNKRCVNPDHLEMLTPAEHLAVHMERPTGRHGLSDRCGKGHLFTPENTYIRTGGARVCRKCANERIKD